MDRTELYWASGYLSAMIDGEGCVTFSTQRNGSVRRNVRISNTDLDVARACVDACKILGVHASLHGGVKYKDNEKPVWEVYVGGNDLQKLATVVDLKVIGKKKRLLQAAFAQVRAHRQRRDQPIEEALEMRRQGKTYEEIGKHFGSSKSAAFSWVKKGSQNG